MTNSEPRCFAIDDLYPYEPSALQSTVEYYKKQLTGIDTDDLKSKLQNKEGRLPKVLDVDGEWMVVEGNSRVFAAKQAGHLHIYADVAYRNDMVAYQRTLQIRKNNGQRGFIAFPVDVSKDARRTRNLSEF